MNPITLSPIHPSKLRYSTVGDWFLRGSEIEVLCADTGECDDSVFLVMLHEMIEAKLCLNAGITEEDVTEWDVAHPELEEPGDHPDAPYHKQHCLALIVEQCACKALGLSWEEHESNVAKIADAVDTALGVVKQSKTISPLP